MGRPSYLWAAFNARPFDMPVPPNWLALAAFGLLGGLLNPGFLLVGAGLELAYLWTLSGSRRFRAVVDAAARPPSTQRWQARQRALIAGLDAAALEQQEQVERRCQEIAKHLAHLGVDSDQQQSRLRQLSWLHLRLLAARSALNLALQSGDADAAALVARRTELERRLGEPDLDRQLRESLSEQHKVIVQRQDAHTLAASRREFVDAELERIRQQVALTHEQALLATDADSIALSVDALAASLGEANRWLSEQRDMLAGLDMLDEPPADLPLQPARTRAARARRELQ